MTVEEAQAAIEQWRQVVSTLEEQLKAAEKALEEATQARTQAMLEQAAGKGSAKSVAEAIKAQATARNEVESIKLALPEARQKLAAAEAELVKAKQAEARKRFNVLAAERQRIAKEIDRMLADLAEAMIQYYRVDEEQGVAARQGGLPWSRDAKELLTDAVAWYLGPYGSRPDIPNSGLVELAAGPSRRGGVLANDPYARPERADG
ncbi:MAG TPA: hypothetical protein GXX55_03565 [Firmicutes bacterium]|nr:hypothetical protein [Bacillota bacterium]